MKCSLNRRRSEHARAGETTALTRFADMARRRERSPEEACYCQEQDRKEYTHSYIRITKETLSSGLTVHRRACTYVGVGGGCVRGVTIKVPERSDTHSRTECRRRYCYRLRGLRVQETDIPLAPTVCFPRTAALSPHPLAAPCGYRGGWRSRIGHGVWGDVRT